MGGRHLIGLPYFHVSDDEEKLWHEFLKNLNENHGLDLPLSEGDGIWSRNYPNFQLNELQIDFENGDQLAAWRAIRTSSWAQEHPPEWAIQHLCTAFDDFIYTGSTHCLTGEPLNKKGGNLSTAAGRFRADLIRARKYAALLVADHKGYKDNVRVTESSKILSVQGICFGAGNSTMKKLWTKLKRDKHFGCIHKTEFLSLLYYAWFIYHSRVYDDS